MTIAFTPLGSGSKGNSILVETDSGKFLIDCGFCIKSLKDRLAEAGTDLEEIQGVLITHEHSDHIKSASMLSDRCGVPIIGHERTLRWMRSRLAASTGLSENCVMKTAMSFSNLAPFKIAGITAYPFQTPHDAVAPVGYRFEDENLSAVYATDIGYVTSTVKAMVEGANLVMFESNYDRNMLIRGKYPPALKERILSNRGHLSNDDCALEVSEMFKAGTKNIILGHISEENNLPELVYERTVLELNKLGAEQNKDFYLTIALQGEVGEKRYAK